MRTVSAPQRGARPGVSAPLGYRDAVFVGAGATSRVYRATCAASGETVALKRLHRQLVSDAEALARLKRELAALGNLRHAAILPVKDVIHWEGEPTIVMSFVEGEDLHERLERLGPLPIEEVESIARALFDVLATVHGAGIVHRDVKPHNVRIGADGQLYLLDFGSARLDAASQLTTTGTTVGTPEYMPPELFSGSAYDPRVDIYGVGATLYQCLSGDPPQRADSLAELAYVRHERPVAPVASVRPDTPAHVAQVVDRCLQREPGDRYASATLAVWALDHGEAERLFQARRSRHPLCLHCDTPIPAASAICPQCKTCDPFVFQSGLAHVEIESVQEPQRFFERVMLRYPERCHPDEVRALAERCAATSYGRQRFLSFIDEKQAASVVRGLADCGARAQVAHPARGIGSALLLWVAVLASGVVLSIRPNWGSGGLALALAPLLMALLLTRGLAAWRGRQSMLSRSSLPRSLWPQLQVGSLVCAGVAAAVLLPATYWLRQTRVGASLLAVLVASLLLAGFATLVRFWRGARGDRSPEPSVWSQLGQALAALVQPSRRQRAQTAQPSKISGGQRAAVMVLFLMLVPLEVGLLVGPLSAQHDKILRARATAALRVRSSHPQPEPDWLRARRGVARGALGPDAVGLSRRATARRSNSWLHVGHWPYVAWPFAVALFFAISLLRRRRRISLDAEALLREIDQGELGRLALRTLPRRTRGRHQQARTDGAAGAQQMAWRDGRGGFVCGAIRRACDLADVLDAASARHLEQALVALQDAEQHVAERALASRCLLEADASHATGMRFLALEGRLEAEAATRWAQRIAARRGAQP
ncbi:MAG: serine/threonine protein kinase [Myxococcales bacterium]|nr:serine/threonine protein kinase [Myxococcales bacterium]